MRRRLIPALIAALAAVVVALVLDRGEDPAAIDARVVRVVDGDTIVVSTRRDRAYEQSVRLLGIDTPETRRPGTPVECGGPEATANLERLAPPGTPVTLEPDPSQDRVDRFGRLAYVRLPDGQLAEEAQLGAGWASVYVYGGRPVAREPAFLRAQADARSARRGVWGRCGGSFHSAS